MRDHSTQDSEESLFQQALEQRSLAERVSFLKGACSLIGRYKLLQQIGEGGIGVVYLAEQQEPIQRKGAVKIIKVGMDTKHVVAQIMNVSKATAKRHWEYARAWLFTEIKQLGKS